MDPLLEVVKVECIGVTDLSYLQPFNVVREVVAHLLTVEYAVHHVAAE